MIEQVRISNVRGITKSVDISSKTLLTGPNGCGKSSVVIGAQLAILGYIPGFDKKGVFANASDTAMSAGVTIDGKTLDRAWHKGKRLSETITIDGVTQSKNAATGMIQLALGREPRIVDVDAFFAATATEKRREVLRMVVSVDELEQIMKDETEKREAKNMLTRERQELEKVVSSLCVSKAEDHSKVGDRDRLTEEIKEIEESLHDLRNQHATGVANDKAREILQPKIDDKEEIEKALASHRAAQAEIEELALAITEKAVALGDAPALPDPTKKERELESIRDVANAAWTEHAERKPVPTEGIPDPEHRKIVRHYIQTVEHVFTGPALPVDDVEAMHDADKAIKSICPSDEELAEQIRAVQEWEKEHKDLELKVFALAEELTVAETERVQAHEKASQEYTAKLNDVGNRTDSAFSDLSRVKGDIERCLERIQDAADAAAQIEKLGAGADAADATAISGLESRLGGLREKERVLIERDTVSAEAEKARLNADEARTKEETATEELKEAIEKQAEVVRNACEELATRSKGILPSGELKLEDDGKSISLAWCRDDVEVQRHTLSGGERAIFDAAVGYALSPKALVVIEAAEVDTWPGVNSMETLLAHLAEAPCEILICSCHAPTGTVPEAWTVQTIE